MFEIIAYYYRFDIIKEIKKDRFMKIVVANKNIFDEKHIINNKNLLPKFYDANKARSESVIGYILLKHLIENEGRIYDELNVRKSLKGKPYFLNNEIYFNISHSKNFVICAISDSEVGVDIEENREVKNIEEKILNNKDDSKSFNSVLDIWVIKEAYSKLVGDGLRMKFSAFSISDIRDENSIFNISTDNYIAYVVGSDNNYEISEVNDVKTLLKSKK